MKQWIILFVLGFFALGCTPNQSEPTFVPLLALGPTATPTVNVPTPTPPPSNTIQVSYAYAYTDAGVAELVLVAEYDLPGSEDVLLSTNLDIEALKLVKGTLPVFNLMIGFLEGTNATTGFTDQEGRYIKTLPSVETSVYLPEWDCTDIAPWEFPDGNGGVKSKGGTLTCQKTN